MGRVKSALIKRTAEGLLSGPEGALFTTDFAHNKRLLGTIGTIMPDKSVRNKVAGYIARLKRPVSVSNKSAPVVAEYQEE